jgi:hypothetical protein
MRTKCRSIATFHRPIHSHWSLPLRTALFGHAHKKSLVFCRYISSFYSTGTLCKSSTIKLHFQMSKVFAINLLLTNNTFMTVSTYCINFINKQNFVELWRAVPLRLIKICRQQTAGLISLMRQLIKYIDSKTNHFRQTA